MAIKPCDINGFFLVIMVNRYKWDISCGYDGIYHDN